MTATQRKLRFVRIALPNDRATTKAVSRARLTVAHLNKLFNADVECLQEETTGVTIWPDHWAAECLPAPALYTIRERVWPQLEPDALETHEYRGGTRVVVDNVPEDVTAGALVTWLRAGLDDDDPDYSVVKQRHDEAEAGLKLVCEAIEKLPDEGAENGSSGTGGVVTSLSDAAARAERAQGLNAARTALEGAVAAARAEFEHAAGERARIVAESFNVRHVDTKLPLRLAVWEVRFARTPVAARMAYVAVHKLNWRDFRLAVHPATGAAVAGRGDDLRKSLPPGYIEASMRGVTVTRRRHGRGTFRFEDERGYYAGAWVRGVRDGPGVELNALGRFIGTFRRDWRRGEGRQVYSCGDGYTGTYGCSVNHPRESLLYGDEYCDGTPHGIGRAVFVDGSVYEGGWRDGLPAGRGRYLGADGVVLEGDFDGWGGLHGLGSATGTDVTRIGSWRHGLQHGDGTEVDAALGEFAGSFRYGVRYGHGTQNGGPLGTTSKHVGWWRNGMREGRGALNYWHIRTTGVPITSTASPPRTNINPTGAGALLGNATTQPGAQGVRNVHAVDSKNGPEPPKSAARGVQSLSSISFDWAANALNAAMAAVALEHGEAPSDPSGQATRQRHHRQEYHDGGELGRHITGNTTVDAAAEAVNELNAQKPAFKPKEQHFRPYQGDVLVETRWRAGLPRGGGLLTQRNGTPVPTAHNMFALIDGRNIHAPAVDAVPRIEAELWSTRAATHRANVASVLRARLSKEAENAASYAYWTRRAATAFKDVVRRTRQGRWEVDTIRAELTGVQGEDDATDTSSESNDEGGIDDEESNDDDPVVDTDLSEVAVHGQSRSASASTGQKRPRTGGSQSIDAPPTATPASQAPEHVEASSANAGSVGERVTGSGRIITSGPTLHGVDTRFQKELQPGDAIEIVNPTTQRSEIRIIKMVLSDKSAGINAPFSVDLIAAADFMILRLPREVKDAKTLAAEAEKTAHDAERAAFGTFASAGGTVLTYRVRKEGVHGGYKIESKKLDTVVGRGELLDMRAKHKSDKHCH